MQLAEYLQTLTPDQLTRLVQQRRDATLQPVPKNVEQLAARLLTVSSIAAACSLLTRPHLLAIEAAAALGDGCTTARLATLFGRPANDPDLAAALGRLTELALIWPQADGLAAAHLSEVWPHPLGLGPGAGHLLGVRDMGELLRLARRYGVSPTGLSRVDLVAALVRWLAQPENVRGLVAQAPASVGPRLSALARRPESAFSGRDRSTAHGSEVTWAIDSGLLVTFGWGGTVMPREVMLALREGDVLPFNPLPPVVPTTAVAPDSAEREASAAASQTLAAITAVVQAMGKAPVALLKTGGLGVRELRRLAKAAGQDEDTTRLAIEVVAAGGLTETTGTDLTPSFAYDEFAADEPAGQLVSVIDDWLMMPACPLAPADSSASAGRVLYWDEEEEIMLCELRAVALRTLVDLVPEGQAAALDHLGDRMAWERPVIVGRAGENLERYVTGIWREAHRLGLIARGAPTRICRAILSGDADASQRCAAAMLPEARTSVVLQNDLTAVVTGTPSASLLTLLDTAATPESRTGAWTWRFSPASVRAALDAGRTPADLIAQITAVAEGRRVPQTLVYLIDDVGRQHGRVQVRPAGCCLTSDDTALLTEILATRSLHGLSLVQLAPTVLVSARPPAETLTALRAAGYAPAGLHADGRPAIEIPHRRRAGTAPTPPDADDPWEITRASEPADLVRVLTGARGHR